jgi:hypothetical protein
MEETFTERWSRENPGTRRGLHCTSAAGGRGGEGHGFSDLLESHMTYLAGSHVLRSWPGIRLKASTELDGLGDLIEEVDDLRGLAEF